MRHRVRLLATLLLVAGVLVLVWTGVVWQWQDPFTALYTLWRQHELTAQYTKRAASFRPLPTDRGTLAGERHSTALDAARYRRETHRGEAIGRIIVPRMGINMIVVDGTDSSSLRSGPGRDLRTFMPGENRLIYIAGHRTTYLAPFAHIDRMRRGDTVTLELPYGTFIYRVNQDRIVRADDLSVLRSPRRELLILQACHPRFFATDRFLVYGRLVRVEPRRGSPYNVEAAGVERSAQKR